MTVSYIDLYQLLFKLFISLLLLLPVGVKIKTLPQMKRLYYKLIIPDMPVNVGCSVQYCITVSNGRMIDIQLYLLARLPAIAFNDHRFSWLVIAFICIYGM